MLVTLALNPLEPATWTQHETDNVCEFLVEQFGAQFPDTGHIYQGDVSFENDVTPGSPEDIKRLQALPGPFHVVIYPGATALPYIIAVVLAVASYILAPSATSAPVVAQRNTSAASPNNELSDRTNKARPNARIPDIFGTVRSTPDLIAAPYKVFENGREVEYAYMCIGRGHYDVTDIRDGDTLCSNIPGTSVAVYAPYTSPNSGDDPQIQIGSDIRHQVLNAKRSNSVNGQVLRPPNSATFTGLNNVIFTYPNIIELQNTSASEDFTKYFVEGDSVTISNAALSSSGSFLTTINAGYAGSNIGYIKVNSFTFAWFRQQGSYLVSGASVVITQTTFDGGLDLSGTYIIDSVLYTLVDFMGFDSITLTFVNPAAVNSNWSSLTDFTQNMFTLAIIGPPLTIDLAGTYTVVSVTSDTIVLDDPESVAPTWANIEAVGSTPLLSPTIVSSTDKKYIGPYILDAFDLTSVLANFVAQSGLYKDNGTDQYALTVEIDLELTPVDSTDTATGPAQHFSISLIGSATLKETVAITLKALPLFTGRCAVRAGRVTATDTAFTGTVVDEVRWRDLYSISPVTATDFGNVTTVQSVTFATSSALAVKERRLNMEVSRKIPLLVDDDSFSAFTTELTASTSAAEIFCAICLDPYIGRRSISELDIASIYNAAFDANDYFGSASATRFSYTFDSDNMSFEETVNAVAEAMFCVAYRRGNVIKLSFEKATDDSVLLFNHRNKLPGTEKRTISFGIANDNDGIEYSYVDHNDDGVITIYLPESTPALNPKKIESIGIRNDLQAYFHAWRLYNKLKYQRELAEFEATQEADLLVRNDRILNTDGTRPYTQDGEVIEVSGLELTLSQNVQLFYYRITTDSDFRLTEVDDYRITEDTYTIFLQLKDGTTQAIACTEGSAANKVVLAAAPRLSLVTDQSMYARTTYVIVGSTDMQQTAFLVTEKKPSGGFNSTVTAVNYDARYYSNDLDFINDVITENGYGSGGGYVDSRGNHVVITDPPGGGGSGL